jgi:hypothetical protein
MSRAQFQRQPVLPFGAALDFAPAPRARHTDPEASYAAAARAKRLGIGERHRAAILAVLSGATRPIDCYDIAACTAPHNGGVELSQVQVCRRMADLLELGLVRVEGEGARGRLFVARSGQ